MIKSGQFVGARKVRALRSFFSVGKIGTIDSAFGFYDHKVLRSLSCIPGRSSLPGSLVVNKSRNESSGRGGSTSRTM